MNSKQDVCKCGHGRRQHTWWGRLGQYACEDCDCHKFTPGQPIKVICVRQIGSASFEAYETTIDETLTKREREILEMGWD